MTEIEELKKRISLLEKKFREHFHEFGTVVYMHHCPGCDSFRKPVSLGDNWICPDCGRIYKHGDFKEYFMGVPAVMPEKGAGKQSGEPNYDTR